MKEHNHSATSDLRAASEEDERVSDAASARRSAATPDDNDAVTAVFLPRKSKHNEGDKNGAAALAVGQAMMVIMEPTLPKQIAESYSRGELTRDEAVKRLAGCEYPKATENMRALELYETGYETAWDTTELWGCVRSGLIDYRMPNEVMARKARETTPPTADRNSP